MKSHMPRSVTAATLLIFAFAGITSAGPRQAALESLATRFARDVYPLLSRQANGCAVCHNAQSPQLFQVLDSAGATFSLILEHDLLAPEDPMAIPGRLSSADPELRRPVEGRAGPDPAVCAGFEGNSSRIGLDYGVGVGRALS